MNSFSHFYVVSLVCSSFSFLVLIAQSHILVDCWRDLVVDVSLHVSLCSSSIKAEPNTASNHYGKTYHNYFAFWMVFWLHKNELHVVDIVSVEILPAIIRFILETSTYCVEHGFNFKLTSKGLIVYHNSWEKLRAILCKVINFCVDKSIHNATVLSCIHVVNVSLLSTRSLEGV